MTASEQQCDNNGTKNPKEEQPLMGGDAKMVTNVEERSWGAMKLAMAGAAVFFVAILFAISTGNGFGMTSSQSLELFASCPEMEGYIYYNHRDSSGSDLINVGYGQYTPEELAAWCDQEDACLGFNTDGWMKGEIKDVADWDVWGTETKCKGLYVKSTCEVVAGFTFYNHEDSSGGDLLNVGYGQWPPDALGDWCLQENDCKGFNTDGWMKGVIKDESDFNEWGTETKCKGLYVKDPCDYIPGFKFYNHEDSPGGDLLNVGYGQWTPNELAGWCSQEEDCLGFNTDGWMKGHILDTDEWNIWGTEKECKGLYLKTGASTAQR